MDKKTKLVRAAVRGTSIIVGMMATWAAAAIGIALATHIDRGANPPAPVPAPVAIAEPVSASPDVDAEPAREATPPVDDAGIQDKAQLRAIRKAVKAFCESSAGLKRGYYDEKPKTTKARACRDIRSQLRHLGRLETHHDPVDEAPTLTVSFDDKRDFLTYWDVSLRPDRASWTVTSVDYSEDCTGP